MAFFPEELQAVVAAAAPLALQPIKSPHGCFSAGEMTCGYSSSTDSPQPQSAGLTNNSALPFVCL